MKIYLRNDNTGGMPLERRTLIGQGYHLTAMPAMIAKYYDKILLTFFYDVLGKGSVKDTKNSLLKKGELK